MYLLIREKWLCLHLHEIHMNLKAIKQIAKIQGLTVGKLALKTGMKRQKLSKILNNKVELKVSDMNKLIEALGLELRILVKD